jgi:hypothetical protein
MMAQYRALTDIFTPAPECRYAMAGQVLADDGTVGAIPIPKGWSPPTNAVDPLSSDGIQAYWNVGPKGMSSAQPYQAQFTNGSRWSDVFVAPAVVYWKPVDPTKPQLGFVLTGGGSSLGAKPPM